MTKSLLTEKNFWKKGTEQSRKNKLPIKLNKKVRADRSFIEIFDNYFKNLKQDKECIEIGCNPGKFLIYFSENLGYKISGVDYDEDGIKLTNENITSLGIEAEIYQADIFEFQIKKKFDAVISMGFIEHFTNDKLDRVLESHLNLLKEDGLLFISIPNFRYINYLFSYFFRYDMISKHNLNMMNEDFFVLYLKNTILKLNFLVILEAFILVGLN